MVRYTNCDDKKKRNSQVYMDTEHLSHRWADVFFFASSVTLLNFISRLAKLEQIWHDCLMST
jgi:hypothetical protein